MARVRVPGRDLGVRAVRAARLLDAPRAPDGERREGLRRVAEELELGADVDDGGAGQQVVARASRRLARGVELAVAKDPGRGRGAEEVVLERHEEVDLVADDRPEREILGARQRGEHGVREPLAGARRLQERVGDLGLLRGVLDAAVVADQEERQADALPLEICVERARPVAGHRAVHAERPAADGHRLRVVRVPDLLVVRREPEEGEDRRARRGHALNDAKLRVDRGRRAVVVGGREVVREVRRQVRRRQRLRDAEPPGQRAVERVHRRLGGAIHEKRHVVVVDA